jgi:hypothetical protein
VLRVRNVPGALAELAKRRPKEMISELTGVAPDKNDTRGWCPMSTIAGAITFTPNLPRVCPVRASVPIRSHAAV